MDRSLCASPKHRAVLSLFRAAHGVVLADNDIADIEAAPPEEIVSISSGQGIAPLMADGLDSLNADQLTLDPDLVIFFREIRSGNRVRNEKMKRQLLEAASILGESQIPIIVLKGGCELVSPTYDELHKRFIGDLDLLVAEASLDEAIAALEAADYVNAYEQDKFYASPEHHDAPLVSERWPAAIELHQAIGGQDGHHLLPARQIFAIAVSTPVDNVAVPSIGDRLIHLVFHHQVQHRGFDDRLLSLRTIADLAATVVDADHVKEARKPFDAAGLGLQFDGLFCVADMVLPGVLPQAVHSADAMNWARQTIERYGDPGGATREFRTRQLTEWASGFATDPERRSVYLAKLFSRGGIRRMVRTMRSLRQR